MTFEGIGSGMMMGYGPVMDGQLAYLKSELGITEAQTQAWDDYVKALKDRAATMQSMHSSMMQAMQTGTALDRMRNPHPGNAERARKYEGDHARDRGALQDADRRAKEEGRPLVGSRLLRAVKKRHGLLLLCHYFGRRHRHEASGAELPLHQIVQALFNAKPGVQLDYSAKTCRFLISAGLTSNERT